jgi:outer membrane protein assembly factor BamA
MIGCGSCSWPLVPPLTPAPDPYAIPSHASAGGVGSGRNFVAGSAELRIPLVSPVEGTLFADYGSDLDSGASVLGDPAGARGKPGARAAHHL